MYDYGAAVFEFDLHVSGAPFSRRGCSREHRTPKGVPRSFYGSRSINISLLRSEGFSNNPTHAWCLFRFRAKA
jgi:hypothetical protein